MEKVAQVDTEGAPHHGELGKTHQTDAEVALHPHNAEEGVRRIGNQEGARSIGTRHGGRPRGSDTTNKKILRKSTVYPAQIRRVDTEGSPSKTQLPVKRSATNPALIRNTTEDGVEIKIGACTEGEGKPGNGEQGRDPAEGVWGGLSEEKGFHRKQTHLSEKLICGASPKMSGKHRIGKAREREIVSEKGSHQITAIDTRHTNLHQEGADLHIQQGRTGKGYTEKGPHQTPAVYTRYINLLQGSADLPCQEGENEKAYTETHTNYTETNRVPKKYQDSTEKHRGCAEICVYTKAKVGRAKYREAKKHRGCAVLSDCTEAKADRVKCRKAKKHRGCVELRVCTEAKAGRTKCRKASKEAACIEAEVLRAICVERSAGENKIHSRAPDTRRSTKKVPRVTAADPRRSV